jgi:hypothetical protein
MCSSLPTFQLCSLRSLHTSSNEDVIKMLQQQASAIDKLQQQLGDAVSKLDQLTTTVATGFSDLKLKSSLLDEGEEVGHQQLRHQNRLSCLQVTA